MIFFRAPIITLASALGIIVSIERFAVPIHHVSANRNGIFTLELIALGLLFSAAVWDKMNTIKNTVRGSDEANASSHQVEIFTWNEIAKVFACILASMAIFVAVIYVLENGVPPEKNTPADHDSLEH